MAQRLASYRQEPIAGGSRFLVTPAPYPQPWSFLAIWVFFALAALFAAFAGGRFTGSSFFLLIIAAGLGFAAWRTFNRGKSGREPTAFEVTGAGIKLSGAAISRAELHFLQIDNDISHEVTQVPVKDEPIIAVGGVLPNTVLVQHGTSISRPAAEKAAAGYKKLQREVSWRVDAEANGRATRVAGGLDQVTARGLATDILRCLQAPAV